MKFHALAVCAAAMALCACSTTLHQARDEQPAPVSGFTPIATTMPSPGFCQGAAASDRLRAQLAGFDAATVDRVALQSLQQCRTLLAAGGYGFERVAAR